MAPGSGRPAGRPARSGAACPAAGREGSGRSRSSRSSRLSAGRHSASGGRHGRWGRRTPSAAVRRCSDRHRRVRSVSCPGTAGAAGAAARCGQDHRRTSGPGSVAGPADGGHPRDLQRDGNAAAEPEVGAAGEIDGQVGGVRSAEHVARVGLVGRPQAEAQGAVGADLRRDHPTRSLRGQDEVHPQGPSSLGDGHQAGDERGQFLGQGGELVDHDDQPGELHLLREGGDVGDGMGRQDRLPAGELGAERPQGARGALAVEVGDQADGVRERGRLGEGGAALVVDEQERAPVRRMAQRQRGDQGLQQLGLARTGGARDQGVRALAAEIDLDGAFRGPSHRRHEAVPRARPRPGRRAVLPEPEAGSGQVEQADARGQRPPGGDGGERRQVTGELRGGRTGEAVDQDGALIGQRPAG